MTVYFDQFSDREGVTDRTLRRYMQPIRESLLRRIPGGVPNEQQADLIRRRLDIERDIFDAKVRRKAAYMRADAAKGERARAAAVRDALEYERRIDDRRGKVELTDRNFAASLKVPLPASQSDRPVASLDTIVAGIIARRDEAA
jgi:hypothetical protein